MEIKTSLDVITVCDKLRKDLGKINYNPDLRKMLQNIEQMGHEISKLEVECRRTKNNTRLIEPLNQINNSVKHLEQFIFLATLMD